MKRDGWQHGAVRGSRSKVLRTAAGDDNSDADAVVETAAAAARKPTNASRSTGKCRRARCAGCHAHPVSKARDKAKGARKLRACDVALNHRLVSWRVVDQGPGYSGASASSLLAYLAGGSSWHEEEEDDDEGGAAPDGRLSDLYDLFVGRGQEEDGVDAVGEIQAVEEQGLLDAKDGEEEEVEDDGDDMGFCMVGTTIALEFSDGEEDWIVVEEI
ncbi:hypothetical protein Zm00014a_032352 [Zea mays]|jgi:hypothetical protein|uniref:Uncharacterized protein n=2 Tax=Zea mays TaxID=4577 RepID=A0A1D6LNJ8_MAIZE|nr:uncharacterized protein LOC100277347 [Zea mays]AQK81111.1 hypothetical protein ZEAMMB73_Zm00001d036465 [Zea mays]AQK81113.1 hypothetical protein ZEAMMB73_Zm00001d036468 [Zea mays]PWZ19653.1 hypothetical protein Zm00014a_032352 [Zea mays]|eukprot:NP_001144411.2 uncharacterized protein LOC100277347 [Zea mays]